MYLGGSTIRGFTAILYSEIWHSRVTRDHMNNAASNYCPPTESEMCSLQSIV